MHATKLDQKDDIEWINFELDGYEGLLENQMPPYRHLVSIPHSYNSTYWEWFPIHFEALEDKERCSRVWINWPLSLVEDAIVKNDRLLSKL